MLCVALAGCSFFEPPPAPEPGQYPDESGVTHPDMPDPGFGPACGNLTLDVRPAVVRVGEPVDIIATLANCGNGTLMVDPGQCPDEGSGFRLLLRRGVNDFHLHAREAPTPAALHDTPCRRGDPKPFGLAPARGEFVFTHQVAFRWDGTFLSDPCWPSEGPLAPACLQTARVEPGEHALRARITGSGVEFTAEAPLVVEGEPAAAEPCARLALAVEGEMVNASVENCGESDITMDPDAACNEPYALGLKVMVDGAPHSLAAGGGALRDVGCTALVQERVVFPGETAWAGFAWNGTVADAGCEPCDWRRVPAGTYELVATLRAREGGEWIARGSVTL